MEKLLKQPLSITAQVDPLSDFQLACTSIHDTDDSISEDCDYKKYHLLQLDHEVIYKL